MTPNLTRTTVWWFHLRPSWCDKQLESTLDYNTVWYLLLAYSETDVISHRGMFKKARNSALRWRHGKEMKRLNDARSYRMSTRCKYQHPIANLNGHMHWYRNANNFLLPAEVPVRVIESNTTIIDLKGKRKWEWVNPEGRVLSSVTGHEKNSFSKLRKTLWLVAETLFLQATESKRK